MSAAPLTPSEVRAAADRLPRVRLAHLPTPLEETPRFAAKIGGGVRVCVGHRAASSQEGNASGRSPGRATGSLDRSRLVGIPG